MSAISSATLEALALDVEQGRPLSCDAVVQLLGLSERALRNAARVAYPLTAPEPALQLVLRELVGLLHLHARGGADAPPLEDNLVWRLANRPVTD